jgi:uncharacterized alpha-E superfamily protein
MLSRVAERMYWAGRYLERAENTARLVRVHGNMLLDLPARAGRTWEQLLTIFANQEEFARRYDRADESAVVSFFIADTANPCSVLSSLELLRENVRTTRDIVPTEGWECVNELYRYASRELPRAGSERTRHRTLSEVIAASQQLTGLLAGTMSHGPGYQFLRLGRNLERADMTTRVLDVPAASLLNLPEEVAPYRYTLWMNVLKSLSAYQMYCQYVRRRIVGEDVIDFLMLDVQFPRSVRHCLGEIAASLESLPRHEEPLAESAALLAEVEDADGASLDAAALHECLDRLQRQLGALHRRISDTWFLPAEQQ